MIVPFIDLGRQHAPIKKELMQAFERVLDSNKFILSDEVKKFEQEVADYVGTKYAIGVSNCTNALLLSLRALGVSEGDEVITTPFTFVATAEVIALLGAKPVYVDIDPDYYMIDVDQIEKAITQKTKAIIPVHLYGQAADMDSINKIAKSHGLIVIEDACQAVGATYKEKKVCSLGDFGCLSYFPAKNLGAYGDGGHVLTSNGEFAEKVRIIRDHGSDRRYHHALLGVNSRLDAMQAAILRVKLKYIDIIYQNASAGRTIEHAQDMKQGTLANAGWSHDGNDLSLVDFKIDAFENLDGSFIEKVVFIEIIG